MDEEINKTTEEETIVEVDEETIDKVKENKSSVKKEHHKKESHKHHKKTKKNELLLTFLVILLCVLVVNLYLTASANSAIKPSVSQEIDTAKPRLQIFKIIDSSCPDCIDLSGVVDSIKQDDVEVTDEKVLDFSSDKVKQFVEKYNIEKVPTVIVTGEINNYNKDSLTSNGEFLVFSDHVPTYIDVKTGKVKGRVSVVYVMSSSCEQCLNLSLFIPQFKELGLNLVEEIVIDVDTIAGKQIVEKYKLEMVPTLIFSPDVAEYVDFASGWDQVGTVEEDGAYVMRKASPPYYDLQQKKVVGLVKVTYLVDKSCEECYDTSLHYSTLTNPMGLAVKLKDEKTVDVSSEEGKALIKKYNIISIPTVILSEDARYYAALVQTWDRVGSVEEDGIYVFRNNEVLNLPYKDLVSGEVVKPEAAQ